MKDSGAIAKGVERGNQNLMKHLNIKEIIDDRKFQGVDLKDGERMIYSPSSLADFDVKNSNLSGLEKGMIRLFNRYSGIRDLSTNDKELFNAVSKRNAITKGQSGFAAQMVSEGSYNPFYEDKNFAHKLKHSRMLMYPKDGSFLGVFKDYGDKIDVRSDVKEQFSKSLNRASMDYAKEKPYESFLFSEKDGRTNYFANKEKIDALLDTAKARKIKVLAGLGLGTGALVGGGLAYLATRPKEEELTKVAMPSYDARRNKQYWQLLKRLHGGTDEAVQGIKQSGDPGIYHGTRADAIPQIEQEGMKVGPFREFGKGTFFGDKATADLYAETEILDRDGFQMGNLWDRQNNRSISDPEEMLAYLKANPDPRYQISEGDLVRLAKPSELRGTKQLYPSVTKAKVFDMKDKDHLAKVAPSQTTYMPENDVAIQRIMKAKENKLQNATTDEEAVRLLEPLVAQRRAPFRLSGTTDEQFNKGVAYEIKGLMDVRKDYPEGFGEYVIDEYQPKVREELAQKLQVPRNDRELHQLQSYGKLRGRRVFERISPDSIRKEFFFDQTNIPPELLRHTDGQPMPTRPLQEVPSVLPSKQPQPETIQTPVETQEPHTDIKEFQAKIEQRAKERQRAELQQEDARGLTQMQQRIQRGSRPNSVQERSEPPRNPWPLVAGAGLGGAGLGGLAYLAHQRKKEE